MMVGFFKLDMPIFSVMLLFIKGHSLSPLLNIYSLRFSKLVNLLYVNILWCGTCMKLYDGANSSNVCDISS